MAASLKATSVLHSTNRTVNEIIFDKLPVSLELGRTSLAVALVLGITLGVIAAVKRNSWMDYFSSSIAMMGICIPTFVLGPVLVLVFAIYLGWFNASGWYTSYDRVFPAATLGLVYSAYVARLTRGGMIEILNQDYIRTARAKGASELRVIFKHALRGGLLLVISFLGPAIAGILTGSFVIETIFQIPGLGREFVHSAFNRDYTLVVLGTVGHCHPLRLADYHPQPDRRRGPGLPEPQTEVRISPIHPAPFLLRISLTSFLA